MLYPAVLLDDNGDRLSVPSNLQLQRLGMAFMKEVQYAHDEGQRIGSAAEETLDMIEEWGKQDG